jgi:flagellar secretion chaperone FliS
MDASRLYREATITGASPIALVVRLYEQIVQDLRQAINAFQKGDVELRTAKINHAVLVVGYLQSQLDFAKGGAVAQTLRDFYDVLRGNLFEAQIRQSKKLLEQQITDVLAVREAWITVQAAESSSPAESQPPTGSAIATSVARAEWNG